MKLKLATAFIIVVITQIVTLPVQAQLRAVECGSVIESEFTDVQQVHQYSLTVEPGASFRVSAIPLGQTLIVDIAILDPIGNPIVDFTLQSLRPGDISSVQTPLLSSRGPYSILLSNHGMYEDGRFAGRSNGVGVYTFTLGCTLADGTVIEPGQASTPVVQEPTPIPNQSEFTGFGFPGISSVDFSEGIEIPLTLGDTENAPIRGDTVALYTYEASAGSSATLTITRTSGDLAIGVTVINRDTNEVLFVGGMPSSNNLSVELTFPTDGTYAIGVFRLNIPSGNQSSGAVEIALR